MVKKLLFLFAFLVVINLFVGSKGWPPPQNLPSTPNCAADGPNCKQFNPDLK